MSLLLTRKTESYDIIFQDDVNESWASWIKTVVRVELMDMLGNRSSRPQLLSPKNNAQVRAGDR
jgi:hypothetical protein